MKSILIHFPISKTIKRIIYPLAFAKSIQRFAICEIVAINSRDEFGHPMQRTVLLIQTSIQLQRIPSVIVLLTVCSAITFAQRALSTKHDSHSHKHTHIHTPRASIRQTAHPFTRSAYGCLASARCHIVTEEYFVYFP